MKQRDGQNLYGKVDDELNVLAEYRHFIINDDLLIKRDIDMVIEILNHIDPKKIAIISTMVPYRLCKILELFTGAEISLINFHPTVKHIRHYFDDIKRLKLYDRNFYLDPLTDILNECELIFYPDHEYLAPLNLMPQDIKKKYICIQNTNSLKKELYDFGINQNVYNNMKELLINNTLSVIINEYKHDNYYNVFGIG